MNLEEAIKEIDALKESENSELNIYIDEAVCCLKNKCFKGATIMIWSTLMFFTYRKISEYGLKNFGRLCKEKGIKFQGEFNQFYDLNKIQDADLLFLARDIGFYDINIENQLKDSLKFRNSCAHVSQSIINEPHLILFIQNIVHYSKLINSLEYKTISKSFIDKVAKMEIEDILKISKEMEFETLKNIFDDSLRIISLIATYEDSQKNPGLFKLVHNVIGNRENDSEKLYFFKEIMNFVNKKGNSFYVNEIVTTISDNVNYLAIKMYLMEDDNLTDLINLFSQSSSFAIAGSLMKAISIFENEFTDQQINLLVKSYLENDQINGESYTVPGIMKRILKNRIACLPTPIQVELEEQSDILE